MSESIEIIVEICLERMEAGASVESCLADYPNESAELEPLLRMTHQMKALAKIGPRAGFARKARLQIENQLAESEKAATFVRSEPSAARGQKLFIPMRLKKGLLQFVMAVVLVFSSATAGMVVYAANASDLSSPLHGVELAVENAQVNLSPDIASKVQLRLEFANRRLTEAQAAFLKSNTANGIEALNEYSNEISDAAQLVGNANGINQGALILTLQNAQAIHTQVLTNLLATVPDQAKEAIQKSLNGSSHLPNFLKPTPGGSNQRNDIGTSTVGTSQEAGTPAGGTENSTDISACATSLSSQTARTLADLAQQYGVEYQYALRSYCSSGSLQTLQQQLSGSAATPAQPGHSGDVPTPHATPPITPPGKNP
jgi:hypothetical protein